MAIVQKFETIESDNIPVLVGEFYSRVRADEMLGPIFEAAIGDRWDEHLNRMSDFWRAVLLAEPGYQGSPLQAHQRVQGIARENFGRWLEIFQETTGDLYEAEAASSIFARAERMGRNLTGALFGQGAFWFQESRQCS